MSEKAMRRVVIKLLKELNADPMAVENPACPGTPDVNFIVNHHNSYLEHWIELKKITLWPKRAETIVQVPHFVPQQRIWLKQRALCGGNVWVLLQVGKEWILFHGYDAANHLGKVSRAELYKVSTAYWPRAPNADQLSIALYG